MMSESDNFTNTAIIHDGLAPPSTDNPGAGWVSVSLKKQNLSVQMYSLPVSIPSERGGLSVVHIQVVPKFFR